jgi:hypothetical protein
MINPRRLVYQTALQWGKFAVVIGEVAGNSDCACPFLGLRAVPDLTSASSPAILPALAEKVWYVETNNRL